MATKISWCDEVWNPVVGCTKCSPGCQNCYAEQWAVRLSAMGHEKYQRVVTAKAHSIGGKQHWHGTVYCDHKVLDKPLRWRKPRRIFLCSMGDLFHEAVPFEFITDVFDVMCSWRWPSKKAEREGDECDLVDPGHTYLVLTKRPKQIDKWLDWVSEFWPGDTPFNTTMSAFCKLPEHIHLGVSISTEKEADEKIPILLQIPAAVHFVSFEPLLEPIFPATLENWDGIDWAIIGCESLNRKAGRFCKDEEDFCRAARNIAHSIKYGLKKPVFIKQLPINGKVVHDKSKFPEDLTLQEYPK